MADYCWTKPSAEPLQNSRTTTAETIQNKTQLSFALDVVVLHAVF